MQYRGPKAGRLNFPEPDSTAEGATDSGSFADKERGGGHKACAPLARVEETFGPLRILTMPQHRFATLFPVRHAGHERGGGEDDTTMPCTQLGTTTTS